MLENGMTKSEEFLKDPAGFIGWDGFKSEMIMPGGTPGCGFCKNLTHLGNQDGTGWKCLAFPDEIPWSIVERDEENHTRHIPGDHGFLYSPRVIVPEGKKIGYYFDWDGNARDAETHKQLVFERDVR